MFPAVQFGLIVENIGGPEILVILFLALVVLGPDRIPELARGAGRLLNNLKKFSSNLTGDMQDVINDPAMQPIRELGEFAARPRQKIAEFALEAEAEERARVAAEEAAQKDAAAEAVASTGDSSPEFDGAVDDGAVDDGAADEDIADENAKRAEVEEANAVRALIAAATGSVAVPDSEAEPATDSDAGSDEGGTAEVPTAP